MRFNSGKNNPLNRMLTVDEVAYTLHVHPTTVRKWEKLGQLKSYRLGTKGNVRFKIEDISIFTDSTSRTLVSAPPPPPETHNRFTTLVQTTEREDKGEVKERADIAAVSVDPSEQVQEALRVSDEKFSSIFHHSPLALSLTRLRDNTIIEINDSYTRFTGYTRDDVIGRKVTELNIWVNPEERERLLKTLRDKGEITNEEFSFRVKSGEVHHVLLSASIINIGGEDCLLVMILDITRRKESEQLLTSLLRNVQIGMYLVQDNQFQMVNPQIQQQTGLSEAELLGNNPLNIVHPDDRAEARQNTIRMLKGQRSAPHEFRIIHKSGEVRTVMEVVTSVTYRGRRAVLASCMDITERKKAEKAVQESEEKFRNLFEHARDAVIIADADTGVLIDINPAGCAMLGRPMEQIVGQHMTIVHPPEMAEKFTQVFREHVERGIVPSEDTIMQRADGTQIPANVSASVVTLGDKKIIQGVFRDVSGRRKSEEALRESEEKFSRAFSAASDAMCIISSTSGLFMAVNDSYVRISGYSRDELIGHNPDELKMWANPEERAKSLRLLQEEGRLDHEEFALRTKSGEVRTCLFSAEPINVGRERHNIVVVQDITERKRAEEALRESEEKFAKAFNASANAICITSLKDNRLLEINESFSRFTGYSHEEVIGRTAAELNLWVKTAERKRWLDALQKDGRAYNHEFQSRMKSGEIRIGLASAEIINIAGEPCRIVAITDITGRKQAEEKLKQALVNLEKSSARLEAANQELEAFSYSVSHDLRSPLRSIDGFSQALLEDCADKLDNTGQDYLRRLRNASQKMGELIDGLLKLSRLSRSEMHREKIDLSALASEIASRLQEMQPERRVEFSIGAGLTINGDPQLLRALLENLLGNAWKFTSKVPQAKIEFGVSRNGRQKNFFVRDNGAGFDMVYADKLFGAFQRLHDITEFPGTGIGLATVRRIVNRHGGTVQAEGETGKGATFYFTLD